MRIGICDIKRQDWNNSIRIRKVIQSFGNNKVLGMYEITPELLKLFSDKILGVLKGLYNIMLLLRYTPSILRTSKVIFLTKPGKTDKGLPTNKPNTLHLQVNIYQLGGP